MLVLYVEWWVWKAAPPLCFPIALSALEGQSGPGAVFCGCFISSTFHDVVSACADYPATPVAGRRGRGTVLSSRSWKGSYVLPGKRTQRCGFNWLCYFPLNLWILLHFVHQTSLSWASYLRRILVLLPMCIASIVTISGHLLLLPPHGPSAQAYNTTSAALRSFLFDQESGYGHTSRSRFYIKLATQHKQSLWAWGGFLESGFPLCSSFGSTVTHKARLTTAS